MPNILDVPQDNILQYTILKFYFLSLFAAVICILIGELIIKLLHRFNPNLKDISGVFRMTLSYVAGLITLTTFYAAYYTNGKTILWLTLGLLLIALVFLKPKTYYVSITKSARLILVFFTLCYSIVAFNNFDFYSGYIFKNIPYDVHYYMNTLLESMKVSKIESIESNFLLLNSHSPGYLPYHYFDLWNAGLFGSLLNVTNINAFTIICPCLYYFGVLLVISLVVNPIFSGYGISLFLGLLFLFFDPGFAKTTEMILFQLIDPKWYGYIDRYITALSEISMYTIPYRMVKVSLIYFIASLSFLLIALRSWISGWIFITMLIVLNVCTIAVIPALLLGLVVFYIHMYSSFKVIPTVTTITIIATLTTLGVFYWGNLVDIPMKLTSYSKTTNISITDITAIIFYTVKFFMMALLAVVVAILISCKSLYLVIQKNSWYALFTLLAIIGSAIGFKLSQLLYSFDDAIQFYYLIFPFLSLFVFIAVVQEIKKNRLAFYFLFISPILTLIDLTSLQLHKPSDCSFEFYKEVVSEKPKKRIGVSVAYEINQKAYRNLHPKKIFLYPANYRFYILGRYTMNYLTVIPTWDLHVPIDSLNPRELEIQEQYVFLDYYNKKRKENSSIDEKGAQIMFLKERQIDWIYLQDSTEWPDEWEKYVRKKIIDKNTRTAIIYLKPWENE